MAGWLYGWKDIAEFVGCDMKTAKKLATEEKMPVYKIRPRKPAAVCEEITNWLKKHKTYQKIS